MESAAAVSGSAPGGLAVGPESATEVQYTGSVPRAVTW